MSLVVGRNKGKVLKKDENEQGIIKYLTRRKRKQGRDVKQDRVSSFLLHTCLKKESRGEAWL